jgi:hypothetical protein
MKPENKKIAIYIGGALVIGAIGFFVYSFFQEPIVVGEKSSFNIGDGTDNSNDEDVSSKPSTIFSQLQDTVFEPIKTPSIFTKSIISPNPLN